MNEKTTTTATIVIRLLLKCTFVSVQYCILCIIFLLGSPRVLSLALAHAAAKISVFDV